MKKLFMALALVIALFSLASCEKKATTLGPAPTISGAESKTIEAGSHFGYLEGITAKDGNGNDITESITYTGKVDPNTVGTYDVTYSVAQDDGQEASVLITITVIKTDKTAPLLTGAGSKEIVVGETFDPLKGVSAIDTVDGDLTASIKAEGSVNVYVPGVYEIKYSISDKTGNTATINRKITVSLGAFRFKEDDTVTTLSIKGEINVGEYGYGIVRVIVNASADGEASVSIPGFIGNEKTAVTSGDNAIYLRYNYEGSDLPNTTTLSESAITVSGATFVSATIGLPSDVTPPTFKYLNALFNPDDVIYLPEKNQGVLLSAADCYNYIYSLSSVQAYDKRDNNYPTISISKYDASKVDVEQKVVLSAKDEAGNEATLELKVVLVSTPTIVDNLNPYAVEYKADAMSKTSDSAKLYTGADSVIRYLAQVEYASASEGGTLRTTTASQLYYEDKLIYLFGSDIQYGYYYLLSITAKATTDTFYSYMRIGQGLSEAPWQLYFSGETPYVMTFSSEEYTTYNLILHFDQQPTAKTYGVIAEWDVAGYNYLSNKTNNILNIKNFTISALSGKDKVTSPYTGEVPVVAPTLFAVSDLGISDDLKLNFTEKTASATKYELAVYNNSGLVKNYEVTNGMDLTTLNLAQGIYYAKLVYYVNDYASPSSNISRFKIEDSVSASVSLAGKSLVDAINLSGRYEVPSDYSAISFFFTASGFRATFTGTKLHAIFNTANSNTGSAYLVVLIDGEIYPNGNTIILNQADGFEYTLACGLENKEHTVEVLKRSEATDNTVKLVSLSTDGSFGDKPADRALNILVIGASTTAGYGNLSTATKSTENSDGLKAYPYLVARMYNANITEFNASGWGVKWGWNDTTGTTNLVSAFSKLAILPNGAVSSTDFNFTLDKKYDLIIMNVGLNDFNAYIESSTINLTGTEDNTSTAKGAAVQQYMVALRDFIKKIHGYYANAKVLLVADDLETKTTYGYWNNKVAQMAAVSSYTSMLLIDKAGVDTPLGSNGHANVQTHIWSADKISAWITTNLPAWVKVNENITFDKERDMI